MKFFATLEVYKTVGEKLRLALNHIKHKIAFLLSDRNYGEGVTSWAYIGIADTQDIYDLGFFTEIQKYSKKKKEVEMRLQIDYDELLKADEDEVIELLCQSLLRSIDIAESKFKIKDFDFGAFRKDLTALFKKEDWI